MVDSIKHKKEQLKNETYLRNTDNVYQKQKRKTCTVYAWTSTKMDERRDTELHVHKTVSSLLQPGAANAQFFPGDLAIATHRQINSANDSIVEAEAPTKIKINI